MKIMLRKRPVAWIFSVVAIVCLIILNDTVAGPVHIDIVTDHFNLTQHFHPITTDLPTHSRQSVRKLDDDPEINVVPQQNNQKDCFYNNEYYGEGADVATEEPCLNCNCSRGLILCYLKVCPEIINPPPIGCVVVHRHNTCCPQLICPNDETLHEDAFDDGNDFSGNQIESRAEPDSNLFTSIDQQTLENGGCQFNGTIYAQGSATATSSLCEYCYCLNGSIECIKPQCMLPKSDCQPVYEPHVCCPVRYDCYNHSDLLGSLGSERASHNGLNDHPHHKTRRLQGCYIQGEFYPEGKRVHEHELNPCESCYCLRGKLHCETITCSPPLKNCVPIIPDHACCAVGYNCSSDNLISQIRSATKDFYDDWSITDATIGLDDRNNRGFAELGRTVEVGRTTTEEGSTVFPTTNFDAGESTTGDDFGGLESSTVGDGKSDDEDGRKTTVGVTTVETTTSKKVDMTSKFESFTEIICSSNEDTLPNLQPIRIETQVNLKQTDNNESSKNVLNELTTVAMETDGNSLNTSDGNSSNQSNNTVNVMNNSSNTLNSSNDLSNSLNNSNSTYLEVENDLKRIFGLISDSLVAGLTGEDVEIDETNKTNLTEMKQELKVNDNTEENIPKIPETKETNNQTSTVTNKTEESTTVGEIVQPSEPTVIDKTEDGMKSIAETTQFSITMPSTEQPTSMPATTSQKPEENSVAPTEKDKKDAPTEKSNPENTTSSKTLDNALDLDLFDTLKKNNSNNKEHLLYKKNNASKYLIEADLEDSIKVSDDKVDEPNKNVNLIAKFDVNATNEEPKEDFRDYDEYHDASLPPSLPNLKIIPFVAADALDQKTSTESPVYSLPVLQNTLQDLPIPVYPPYDSNAPMNLFSPPVETEGGFVPKDTSNLDPLGPYYVADYRSTPIIEITTKTDANQDSCLYNTKTYKHGELLSAPSSCELCMCIYGQIQCQGPKCPELDPGCHRIPDVDPSVCCGRVICETNEFNDVNDNPLFRDPVAEYSTINENIPSSNPDTNRIQSITTLFDKDTRLSTTTEKYNDDELSLNRVLEFLFSGGSSKSEKEIINAREEVKEQNADEKVEVKKEKLKNEVNLKLTTQESHTDNLETLESRILNKNTPIESESVNEPNFVRWETKPPKVESDTFVWNREDHVDLNEISRDGVTRKPGDKNDKITSVRPNPSGTNGPNLIPLTNFGNEKDKGYKEQHNGGKDSHDNHKQTTKGHKENDRKDSSGTYPSLSAVSSNNSDIPSTTPRIGLSSPTNQKYQAFQTSKLTQPLKSSSTSQPQSYQSKPTPPQLSSHVSMATQTIVKDETNSLGDFNNVNDVNGSILKLAGCNIYGRMYRVGRIISELSGPCIECMCTNSGVQCKPLKC